MVEEVWDSIQRFSAYAYNKAHAATYSRISWQGLYLKARYPAEYLASVLRNGAGFYARRVYVEEARRLGARIELPCVNRSDVGPRGMRGTLRLGLDQVKGLRQGTAASAGADPGGGGTVRLADRSSAPHDAGEARG